MKKSLIISFLTAGVVMAGCSDVKRSPGSIYMPDMAYSRAYETYSDHSNLTDSGIHYTAQPVTGTVARGQVGAFHIPKDRPGDSTNYVASRAVPNPLPPLNGADMAEAQRLYVINCGICHGEKLDGNGPLYKGGDGPYPAAPRNLVSDPKSVSMPDGQMFYSITYGVGVMGPYGPQLSRKQRWMIIHYIRAMQNKAKGGAAGTTAGADSTAAAGAATSTTATK